MNTLKIKNNASIQNNFLGLNSVYHCYAGMPDSAGRVYSDELCELEADRAKATGTKIARTYFKWYGYNFETQCWEWDTDADFNAFCKWCERMKKRNIDVAINTGWCCPGDIMSNHWGGKSPFTVPGNWKKSVENYANWVSEVVHQIIEVRKLTNVKYLFFFTEPQYCNVSIEKTVASQFDAWYEATRAAVDKLIKDGRRHLVKIVGPQEGGTANPQLLPWLLNKDKDLIDIYTTHNYLTSATQMPPKHGKYSISGGIRGMRCQQDISVLPDTEYEISISMCLQCSDHTDVSGYVLLGLFKKNKFTTQAFTAGNQPTTRLFIGSTQMVDAGLITDDYKTFTFKLKTPSDIEGSACFGIFADIIDKDDNWIFNIGDISVKKMPENSEIIKNGTFQSDKFWMSVACDICSTYECSHAEWERWVKTSLDMLPKGADFWFDEYNTASKGSFEDYDMPRHGTDLAIARVAFMNTGIQSSLMWTLFDQQWPNNHTQAEYHRYYDGDHRFGVMPVLTRSLVPYPSYYSTVITGYVGGGEGTKLYRGEGEGGLQLSMSEQPDKTVTILLVNNKPDEQEFTVQLEKPLNCTLYRYIYDPATIKPDEKAEPIKYDRVIENIGAEFCDKVPTGAVVAYTNKIR